ncbi:hypothetical protein E2562_010016 [Oryza meyeriana var. granulata]|uniref:Uncharacterized protein n=1 Tax=Oryza meyeriana var. granulata TaxID=110450 RepID=A0A6G1EI09_9ORYZ|nr:hypothetical protein E2562_010016 [Oryza meyeriana var. granulata]
MALAPTSLRCFIIGRPLCIGSTAPMLPPRPTRRPSARLLCRTVDEKGSAPSTRGDLYLKLGRLAMVALAAGVLALGPIDDAMVAKSGGRVGGQAFRSAPWSAPRPSGPRINNSRAKDGGKGMRIEDGLAEERMGTIEDRSG